MIIRRGLYRVSRMRSRVLLSRHRCRCRRRARARVRSAARIRASRRAPRICLRTKVPHLVVVVVFLVLVRNVSQPLRRRRPRTIIPHKRRWRTRGDTSALTPTATPRKPFKLVALFQRKRSSSSSSPFHLPALASACAALCSLGLFLRIVRRMRRNSRRV